MKLRKNSAATMRTTSARATWTPISALRMPAATRRPATRPERGLRIDARELQRRRRAEEQAAPDAEDIANARPSTVDARLKLDRQPRERHDPQRLGAPHRDRRPERGAERGQQDVLGEQQADDAPRVRAERQPHAHLALTRARAREHEVGRVAADREQQEQHHRLQDRRARAVSKRCGPRGDCQNGSTSPRTVAFVSG